MNLFKSLVYLWHMKIGFDAKRYFWNFTGLGNYSRTLLSSLAQYCPEHQYTLFTPKFRDHPRVNDWQQYNNIEVFHPAQKWSSAWWRTSSIKSDLSKKGIDVFHGLSHELPLGIEKTNIKSVVTIHDLIFERYPHFYKWTDRKIYRAKFKSAAQRADKVVAITAQTKRDLIEFYNIDANKIEVIYQSSDPIFYESKSTEAINTTRKKYALPSEYLLYVGSIIERKNLLGLVKAIELLPKEFSLPLVIIGDGKAYKKQVLDYIQSKGLHKQFLFLQKPDFQDFPAIYQGAQALAYPSFFEGFGIPIIEALHGGLPVLTSEGSCFPEAAGPGAVYVKPDSPQSIAQGIQDILGNSVLRKQLIQEGNQYVERFKPETISKQWGDLYKDLGGGKG